MARSLNIVIGADIEKLKKGFDDAIAVIQKSGNQMSADVAKSAKDIQDKPSHGGKGIGARVCASC
jgi:hypothetical protein